MKTETLEDIYGLVQRPVELKRLLTPSGKVLEVFPNPGKSTYRVDIDFPEFSCLCPKTSQPDFAEISISYFPKDVCIELKSCKYYLNSFRNEGHFHEEVTNLIYEDLMHSLCPLKLQVVSKFNVRGGVYPTVVVGDEL